MSIRLGLLALLAESPMYGYQLKTAFEERTGDVWPLNVGQVYTTLGRLERDGLVEPSDEASEGGQQCFRITPTGRNVLTDWYRTPVSRDRPPRDELAVKVLLAWRSTEVDAVAVIQRQRTATVQALQEYTRLKARAGEEDELPWILMLDALILQAESEVRWLDIVEARLHAPPRDEGRQASPAPRTETVAVRGER